MKNYRNLFITLIIIFCITAAILTVDRAKPTFFENSLGFVIVPVQKVNTTVFSWIKSRFHYFVEIEEVKQENLLLKSQLLDKKDLEDKVNLLKIENEKLSALLDLDSKYNDYPKTAARIIAKDPGNWYDTFIIDKGTHHGLSKNMVVMADGGLVGRIKECGTNYSKVVSIIDDSDAVSAKSLRTDDVGFVRGDLMQKGFCRMEYIDNDAEIIVGDEIITSHLSEIYPPGITIGYVKEVSNDSNTLTKLGTIEPTVDFKHLETVLVINHIFEKNNIKTVNEVSETTTSAGE